MNSDAGRICPLCAEPIKPTARICPHCRQWLTFRSLRNPAVASWILTILFWATITPLVLFMTIVLRQSFNPRPFYYESMQRLRLTQSQFGWKQYESGLRVVITGVVSNESSIPWQDPEFECRFFDANGVMIDVANPHTSLTIEPHDDTAFRFLVVPARATNSYSSFRLSITTARNGQNRF